MKFRRSRTGNRVNCARRRSTGAARTSRTGTEVVDCVVSSSLHPPSWPPFARPALPSFVATMGPLTPEQPVLLTGRFPEGSPAHERRSVCRSGLSASCVRRGRLVSPWDARIMEATRASVTRRTVRPRRPSDHSVSNHLTAPAVAFARYPSARRASDIVGLGFTIDRQARQTVRPNRVHIMLRTGRSPPVASHPLSPGRSYLRIQAGERLPEKDFHLSDQTHSQTHLSPHSRLPELPSDRPWADAHGYMRAPLSRLSAGSRAWF